MSAQIRFDAEAEAEYRVASQWYEGQRERLGLEFLDAVDATLAQIVAMPRSGFRVSRLPADLSVRRRAVSRFPYHVVYIEMASHIRILAIAHDRRKPGYWRERLL